MKLQTAIVSAKQSAQSTPDHYKITPMLQNVPRHFFTLLRLALAGGMLYYLVLSGSIEWSSFKGLAHSWQFTLVAMLLFFIATVFQAWRLQILINAQHLNLSFVASIRLTFIGLFFNTYLPGATGGDLVKIYYASKGNPGNRTEVITILLLDRFIGLFSLLTIPLLLAFFFTDLIASTKVLQGLLVISAAIAVAIIVIAVVGARMDLDENRVMHWIEHKVVFGSRIKRMFHTLHSYRHQQSAIFKALFISFFLQFQMILVAVAISAATNPQQGTDLKMLVLIPMGYMANSLPVTPGGLGVGEAALESLFKLSGLQGGAEVLLGWRLMMVIVGLLGLVFYLRGEKRFVFDAAHEQKSQA